MTPWHREPLMWHHAKRFERVIRKGDLIECLANGMGVMASLEWAIYQGGGESWAVMEEGRATPVGVYGWTMPGAAWSYWADLDRDQARELMRVTPHYVLEMTEAAREAGLPHLANYVWAGNRAAIAWLRSSHCFDLDLDRRYHFGNKEFISFRTKPLEDLRRCATQ